MALQQVTLEAAAKAFRVHPRTIVRAIANEHNTYWSEDINHDPVKIKDIADAYGTTSAVINRIIERRDDLLKPEEAAQKLGIRPRTFREHVKKGRYNNGKIKHGKIVRYLKSKITEHAIINEG